MNIRTEMQLALNGETQVFFIIGDPIGQVKSPGSISRILAERGENAVLVPGHVKPEGVESFMAGAAACLNIGGIVATIPHKQAMLNHCVTISERASVARSVNVLRREEGGWTGDITDGQGHLNAIETKGGRIDGADVLLVGAGGAGSSIAYDFLDRGAKSLAIHDLDLARRDGLIGRLREKFGDRVSAGSGDPSGFAIISNATPLGMREGDPFPVEMEKLQPGQFCSCVVTKPDPSPFIVRAGEAGCMTSSGSDMFDAQADIIADYLLGKDAA